MMQEYGHARCDTSAVQKPRGLSDWDRRVRTKIGFAHGAAYEPAYGPAYEVHGSGVDMRPTYGRRAGLKQRSQSDLGWEQQKGSATSTTRPRPGDSEDCYVHSNGLSICDMREMRDTRDTRDVGGIRESGGHRASNFVPPSPGWAILAPVEQNRGRHN